MFQSNRNNLSCASLNVRGIRDANKRKKLFLYLRQFKHDIIILQETHSVESDEELWRKQWGGQTLFAHGTNTTNGTCILIKPNTDIEMKLIDADESGRYVITECQYKGMEFTLCGLYAPNKDDPNFFVTLMQKIDNTEIKEKIIVGDFNMTLNAEIDRRGCKENNMKAQNIVKNYIEAEELVDPWRFLNPDLHEFSWCRRKVKNKTERMFARLDFFLCSQSLLSRVESSVHRPGHGTDHSLIEVRFTSEEIRRGKGFWKFNSKLLVNHMFKQGLKDVIEKAKMTYEMCNPSLKWEMIKCEVVSYCKIYSIEMAKQKNADMIRLTETVTYLTKLRQQNKDFEYQASLDDATHKLDALLMDRVQSLAFRSRARWYELGERSSKFFFSMAKSRYNSKVMHKITNRKGCVVSDHEEILAEQFAFYSDLYKEDQGCKYQIKVKSENAISKDNKDALDLPLTEVELKEALFEFAPEKTPGPDGITAELMREMWPLIGSDYHRAVLHAVENEELFISARRGILTLIPKKDRNILLLKAWRPLTMLSICYKIVSKALDNRLKKVMPGIIQDYQTGFMEGRYILTNVLKLMEIMKESDRKKLKTLVLNIDFEKCFDRISHTALRGAMHYFGFGKGYEQMVMLLFKNFELCTTNNGYASRWFQPTRGVHQGCCISPHLFNLTGQIFADIFQRNKRLSGVQVHEILCLLSQFADDTNIFTMANEQNLKEISFCLKYAEINLGLKINYEKTTVCRMGSLINSEAKYYTQKTYQWTDPPVYTLGVYVTPDIYEMSRMNLNIFHEMVASRLNLWVNRSLTLMGRVLVVNTLIESMFVYKLSVTACDPDNILQMLQKEIWTYIWNGKRPKMTFQLLSTNKYQGGLRLVDLRLKHVALLTQWVYKVQENNLLETAMFVNLSPLGHMGQDMWRCNLKKKDVRKLIPLRDTFWIHVLESWAQYNYSYPLNIDEVKKQILWYNSHIRRNEMPFIYEKAYSAGIKQLGDILDDDECVYAYEEFNTLYPGVIGWLEYQGLLKAIPDKWFKILNTCGMAPSEATYEYKYDTLGKKAKITAVIYKDLVSRPGVALESLHKWSPLLDRTITETEFHNAFVNISAITISTKLRDFQFRLLHKKLPTNKELHKWKIKTSPQCDFCSETDNIKHTLYECGNVAQLWLEYAISISHANEGEVFTVNFEEILLNRISKTTKHIVNLQCLVMKQLIYRYKCKKEAIKFTDYEREITQTEQIELAIAKQKNRTQQHNKKWGKFIQDAQKADFDAQQEFINEYIKRM